MRTSSKFVLFSVITGLLGLSAVPASAATTRSITATFSAAVAPTASTLTISGKITKSPKGTTVEIQRLSGSTWKKVTSTRTTSSSGSYKKAFKGSGTPGTYSYRARVAKKGKLKEAKSSTRKVQLLAQPVISTTLPAAELGTAYSHQLTTTTNRVGTWTRTANQLPTGLSMTAGGLITGTPITSGDFTFSVRFVDAKSSKLTKTSSVTITVSANPSISTTTIPEGTQGIAYPTTTLQTVVSRPGTWTSDPLPGGLTLNPTTGVLSGTPTQPFKGVVEFTFTQGAPAGVSKRSFLLVVKSVIETTSLPDGTINKAYPTTQLKAIDNLTGTWSVPPGTLPSGLSLSSFGVLSGTPTVAGTVNVTISFTGAQSGSTAFALRIDPPPPALPAGAVQVSAGHDHSCRVESDHTLACWGANGWGELGFPLRGGLQVGGEEESPVQEATGATNWKAVSASTYQHTCAVRLDYTLYCFGRSDSGQIGNGFQSASTTPVKIGTTQHWTQVAAGRDHTCAVTTGGSAWCWGGNYSGAIGDPTTGPLVLTPVRVGTATDWATISAGGSTTCAVKTNGQLWCWGGVGNFAVYSPVRVGTASDWTSVTTSENGQTCGTRGTGEVWCKGFADALPTRVGIASDWDIVSAGNGHTCATNDGGQIWCWGNNANGQFGNGDTDSSAVPIRTGTASDWASVSAGDGQTCAVKDNDDTYCWGANIKGQVGNGSKGPSILSPVKIS